MVPTGNLFENVVKLHSNHKDHKLKYVIVNLHDTNISNILRFLGYFKTYGYKKFVKFSSSVRFELL